MWSLGCIMAELLSKKASPLLQHQHTMPVYTLFCGVCLEARRCSQYVRVPAAPRVHAAVPGAEIRRAPLPLQVLFDGRSELDQISRIFTLLGSPNEKIWPGLSKLPAASKVGVPTVQPPRSQQHHSGMGWECQLEIYIVDVSVGWRTALGSCSAIQRAC